MKIRTEAGKKIVIIKIVRNLKIKITAERIPDSKL